MDDTFLMEHIKRGQNMFGYFPNFILGKKLELVFVFHNQFLVQSDKNYFQIAIFSVLNYHTKRGRLLVKKSFFVLDDMLRGDGSEKPDFVESVLLLLFVEVIYFDLGCNYGRVLV